MILFFIGNALRLRDLVRSCLKANVAITDSKIYSKIALQEFNDLLLGDDGRRMPLIEERLKVIHEAGSVLIDVSTTVFLHGLLFKIEPTTRYVPLSVAEI